MRSPGGSSASLTARQLEELPALDLYLVACLPSLCYLLASRVLEQVLGLTLLPCLACPNVQRIGERVEGLASCPGYMAVRTFVCSRPFVCIYMVQHGRAASNLSAYRDWTATRASDDEHRRRKREQARTCGRVECSGSGGSAATRSGWGLQGYRSKQLGS